MTDLSTKPCKCGGALEQVIGFRERLTDQQMIPYRWGWYCPKCKHDEKAVGRETYVDPNNLSKK